MDPFEVRMQFLALLRRLNASQQSIQKVVGYALKYFAGCSEDLWDCIVEECQKGSINNRINILYFLDSLCETSLIAKSHPIAAEVGRTGSTPSSFYVDYVTRDLGKIIELVVPEGRQGLPNLLSTKQILESWRSKRVIDPQTVDQALAILDSRNPAASSADAVAASSSRFSRNDVFKRIEEDRERHKRLRERRWVQPVSNYAPLQVPPLATFLPNCGQVVETGVQGELPIDVEFENEWETTSDWNEDDDEVATEENNLCFPSGDPGDDHLGGRTIRSDAMDFS